MTLQAFYRHFLQQLQSLYNKEESKTIAGWIFEKKAMISHADIIKHPETVLDELQIQSLSSALRELLLYKPVQYIVGEAWFYNVRLNVNEHVLIPRPETEELVKWIIDDCKKLPENRPVILDIGTGSGCIPIALQKNLPDAVTTAIDISNTALELAKKNANANNVTINFIEADFLDEHQWNNLPQIEILVSNPPYIPIAEKKGLDKNVQLYEPHAALFVPDDQPLLFYDKIISFSKTHLTPGGKIYAEMHEDYAERTATAFSKAFEDVVIKKDLNGKSRMIRATQFR